MIIFGSNTTTLKPVRSRKLICPNCKKTGTLMMSAHSTHAHLFWIPMFPIKKKEFIYCYECQYIITPEEASEKVKREYQFHKSEIKNPIWKYSGLFLIFFLFIYIFWTDKVERENHQSYLNSPVINDVYEYRVSSFEFSLLKVVDLSEDSVFVVANQYIVNKDYKADNLNIEEDFSDEVFSISRLDLKELYEEKTIYGVIRK